MQAEPAQQVNTDQSHVPAQEDTEQPALPQQIDSKVDGVNGDGSNREEAEDAQGPRFKPEEVDWAFLLEDPTDPGSETDVGEVTGNEELVPLPRGEEISQAQVGQASISYTCSCMYQIFQTSENDI